MRIDNGRWHAKVGVYRSPNQIREEFEIFCKNFNILPSHIIDEFPLYSIVTRDFNARCTNWWKNKITNSAGPEIAFLSHQLNIHKSLTNPHMLQITQCQVLILYLVLTKM